MRERKPCALPDVGGFAQANVEVAAEISRIRSCESPLTAIVALYPQGAGTAAAATMAAAATSVSPATRRTRARVQRASRRWTSTAAPTVSAAAAAVQAFPAADL